jgi:serine/threonine-protein kinase
VTLNLVDATTDRQLRSLVIDNNLSNVSAIQDSTVLRLVEMLEVESQPDQERFLLAGRTASGTAYDLYLQGRGFLQRYEQANAVDTAIILFGAALMVDSQYASAYAGLGEAYWRKYEEKKDTALVELARSNCQRALDLDSHLVEAHLTMGLIRFGTGSYEEATSEYHRALALDSTRFAAYRGLARACIRLNRLDEAETYLKKAIAMKPDYWWGYQDLGSFYLSYGRNEEAIDHLREVVRLLPEDYRTWSDLGALYYQLDHIDDASRAWRHSLEIEPNYAAYANLGSLSFLEGRFTEAAQMFEKALQLDSSDYAVWGNLAMVDEWIPEKRNDTKPLIARAIQLAEKQRTVNPRDPTLLADLAAYYATAGESSKGQTILEEALKLAPDNNDIMVSAGIFYLHLGETDSALVYIQMALEHGYPVDQVFKLPEVREIRDDPRFGEIFRLFAGKSQSK